jgi:hypothetical protein
VQDGEAGGARRRVEHRPVRRRARLEHRRGECRGAGQQPGLQDRLEQLPDHAERQLALELAGAGREHARAAGPRGPGGRVEQPRLADPGRAFEDEKRDARAIPQPLPQLRDLAVPADQPRHKSSGEILGSGRLLPAGDGERIAAKWDGACSSSWPRWR